MAKVTSFVILCVFSIIGVLYCQECGSVPQRLKKEPLKDHFLVRFPVLVLNCIATFVAKPIIWWFQQTETKIKVLKKLNLLTSAVYTFIHRNKSTYLEMEVKIRSKVMVSAFTPFDKCGNLNVSGIPVLIQFFKDQGISSVYLTAYFGEAPSLSYQERCDIVSAWANQGFDLFVEVAAMAFVDVLKFAKFCSEMNVKALTAFSEIVYQPEDTGELVEDLNRICCASSNLPLFTHEVTAVNPNLGRTRSALAAAQEVPCLAGALTTPDTYLKYRAATANVSDNCQFITNSAEQLAAAYFLQMYASTSPAANVFPGLHLALARAAIAGNAIEVSEIQRQISICVSGAVKTKKYDYRDDTTRTYFEYMKLAMYLKWNIYTGARYPLEIPNSTVTEEIRCNLEILGCECY